MIIRSMLFTVLFACCICGSALASCEPRIRFLSSSEIVNYDPFSASPTYTEIRFSLSNNGSSACEDMVVNLVADRGKPRLEYNNNRIFYDVVNEDDFGASRSGHVIASRSFDLPESEPEVEGQFVIRVEPERIVPPGLYRDTLRINVAEGARRKDRILNEDAFDFLARVESHLDTMLSYDRQPYTGTGSLGVVDLGLLQSGLRETVYLIVRGNANARIMVSSENKGKLRHVQDPSVPGIDYDIRLKNRSSDLSSLFTLHENIPQNDRGKIFPLRIEIGEVDTLWGGVYRDVITVQLSAY